MGPVKLIASVALAAAAAAVAASHPAGGAPSPRSEAPIGAARHSLLSSRLLWATVDVCSPPDQPHTIGIRGSMPGDGHPRDTMYMRFGVQYLDPAAKRWVSISHGADSGFLKIGAARVTRQSGRSFQFAPVAGKPAYTLRGSVVFQWRRGAKVLATTTRTTGAGHRSLAGADPPNFSAATCKLS